MTSELTSASDIIEPRAAHTGDRVSELYYGQIFTPEVQAQCRERIDWICEQVQGNRVLDVGCSQGIASILLAQKGHEVVGIDPDPEAVAYAQGERAKLDKDTQGKLSFTLSELERCTVEELGTFDTILLGEVLEHFRHPEKIIETSLSFLRDGGKIIITTPFGYKPNDDHFTTFTLSTFVELVEKLTAVELVEVKSGFIRFTGGKLGSVNSSGEKFTQQKLLHMTEEALLESQHLLFDQIKGYSSRVKSTREGLKVLNNKITRQDENYARLKNELDFSLKKLREQTTRLEDSRQQYAYDLSLKNERIRLLEKVPESFSYRIGVAQVMAVKSPAALVRFPFVAFKLLAEGTGVVYRKVLRRVNPGLAPYSVLEVENKVLDILHNSGLSALTHWYEKASQGRWAEQLVLDRLMFDHVRQRHVSESLKYAKRVLTVVPHDAKIIKVLSTLYFRSVKNSKPHDAESIVRLLSEQCGTLTPIPEQTKDSISYKKAKENNFIEERISIDPDGKVAFYSVHRSALQPMLINQGEEAVVQIVNDLVDLGLVSDTQALEAIFLAIRDIYPRDAVKYIKELAQKEPNLTNVKRYIDLLRFLGRICDALEVTRTYNHIIPSERTFEMLAGQAELFHHGFPMPVGRSVPQFGKKVSKSEIRPYYLLHNSLPYTSGGYACRSHGLLTDLKRSGIDIEALSRLGYPLDLKKGQETEAPEYDNVGEIRYNRLLTETRGYGQTPINVYLKDYADRVVEFCEKRQPNILHGASNFMNGVVANYAGAKLGIPTIYEVRGLWEITRLSRQPDWAESDYYKMQVRMETEACQNASQVIVITNALRDELVRRGVSAEKIHLVPNGVDADRFMPVARDESLARQLGIDGHVVLGYVGSVVDYEGLEYLIQAANILRGENLPFKVLIVGDGAVLQDLKNLVEFYSIEDKVIFTGRVPHEEVERYYSIMDILPYPRKGLPVCEMVSPLKPFESMSMEKAVVSSDVAALKEIVIDGKTGLLHKKDSPEDLARCLKTLIENTNLRTELGKNARQWCIQERSWEVLASKVADLYQEILSGGQVKSKGERPQAEVVAA